MPRLTHNLPAWVGHYTGIPFVERGRDRRGVDCWGLLRLVYAERFGIHLPSHHDGYRGTQDRPGVAAIVGAELDGGANWRPVLGHPDAGDAILFRVGAGELWHVGLTVAHGRMLHSRAGADSCVERWDEGCWRPRLVGTFRFCGPVRLAGRVEPLRPATLHLELPTGGTIEDMLTAAAVPHSPFLRVWIGDREVRREHWAHIRPKAGRQVLIAAVPAGGDGKSPLRLILSIAVLAAAVWLPGALPASWGLVAAKGGLTLAGTMVSAGVTLAGTLAINALIPPPRPRLSDNAAASASPTITGARNEARPFGVVPSVLGEHRMAPLFGAAPYTEIVGDDQYLRLLYVIGSGPVEMTELQIGETVLSEYEGVEVELREGRDGDEPLRLFPGIVLEDSESVLISQAGGWVGRTSATDADELSIDLSWPQGLVEFSADGARQLRSVQLEVEYAPTDTGAWQAVNGASPDFARGMDFLFRTPEVELGGEGTHPGSVEWGLAFAGTKPGYLPATSYSWEASGYVYTEAPGNLLIPHEFGVDCSDAGEITIDDRVVASWYGTHGTAGGGAPDYAAHSGTIALRRGWHRIRVRVEARSTAGAVALGWKRPGDGAFAAIPAASLATRPEASAAGQLAYRWFDTSGYLHQVTVEAARAEPLRRSISWAVAPGQYDIRVRRLTPDSDSDRVADAVYWAALRTVRAEDPVKIPRVAKVALRIKATDQLNGVVDQFNLKVRSILPDWDTAAGAWVERGTSNPASCYRAVLQGPGGARPVTDDRVDLTELEAWHEACQAEGYEFNAVLDFAGTVFERLNDIAAAGRATFGMRDGRYGIVRDKPQSVPIQHFTPRNSSGFRGRKAFADLPHALRIRFLNRDAGYQQDERVVYDDGYTEANATKFETLELFGVTHTDQVWKHGRYHIAVARLRPEVYELTTDIEHLACTRGDLVLVTHDVPMWGLSFGRVVGLITDTADNLVGLRLDESVTMDAGEAYVIRVRLEDGTSWIRAVTTAEGEHTELTLQGPVSTADPRPKVGDLWMFGRLGMETRELLVKAIDVTADLGARLTLVDHAPAVHESDQGPIPPYDPGISRPPAWQAGPDTPVIEQIRSDDFVMIRDADGSLRPRMLIQLRRPSGTRPLATAAQVRTRPVPPEPAEPTGPWTYRPLTPLDGNAVSVEDVEEGETYDIRLRTVTPLGLTSAWVDARHTVIGKSAPPPDVQSFDVVRLSDGTRRYSWDIGLTPPDIAGVVLRYGALDQAWDQMTPLHEGILQSSPDELNEPPAGTWRFAVRAIDTSGNLSNTPLYIERTLGEARLEGVVLSQDGRIDGWPGTREGCHATSEGTLESDDRATWDTLAAFGAPSWDAWTRWVMAPTNPIRYTSPALDAGFIFTLSPDAIAAGLGTIVVEVATSLDGTVWTDWTEVSVARTRTVRARMMRARVTCTLTAEAPIPTISRLLVLMRAPEVRHEIQDLETDSLEGVRRLGVGDVRLPVPAGLFSVIRFIDLSFNGMGAGWSWDMVDRDVVDGPRIRTYNADDLPADGLIDAVIRGIAGEGIAAPPTPPGDAGQLVFDVTDHGAWLAAV